MTIKPIKTERLAWLKFAALAEGARLATRELWRG
jgi:hypothetical protein